MTPDQFRACLAAIHWTQNGVGRVLGLDERQVRRWAAGEYPVPPDVAAWLETLARFHERHPPPRRRHRESQTDEHPNPNDRSPARPAEHPGDASV